MRVPGRRSREESLARVVLVAGLVSGAALVWVATGVLEAPGPAGRAALTRLAGEVADAVQREWARFVAGAAPGKLADGEVFLWPASESAAINTAAAESPEPVEWFDRARDSLSAAEVLLSEAGRLELHDGDLDEALVYALDACAKSPDAALEAEARLRVLQLAARLGRVELVGEHWAAATTQLRGHELRAGLPYLLLSAFVALPALPEAERADALAPLVAAWEEGRLRLPSRLDDLAIGADGIRFTENREHRLLRERFLRLAPELEERVLADDARQRRAAVERPLDGRPRGAEQRWSFTPVGDALFVFRGSPQTRGFFAPRRRVIEAFLATLRERSVLPDGCSLQFRGASSAVRGEGASPRDADPGPVVRSGEALDDGLLEYDLHMLDPQALVSAESARVQTTRVALFVAAAFSAFAALTSWRALHRQARLTRLKSRFIASVSHELRTPVASILLMAENLESGVVTEAAGRARYHGLIRQEALRLRGLVNDVLDFSRLEHGEATRLRCTLVPLPEFVQALGDELVERARQGGVACALECAAFSEQAEALLDAEAVRRGMLNLVDNALKHANGADLSVRMAGAGRTAEAGRQHELLFAVADRGPGIPAARREAVLQPFERLSVGGEGAGLGLAIVRAITEAHGGRLVVRDREQGPGVAFEMRLPWKLQGADDSEGAVDRATERARRDAATSPDALEPPTPGDSGDSEGHAPGELS